LLATEQLIQTKRELHQISTLNGEWSNKMANSIDLLQKLILE